MAKWRAECHTSFFIRVRPLSPSMHCLTQRGSLYKELPILEALEAGEHKPFVVLLALYLVVKCETLPGRLQACLE